MQLYASAPATFASFWKRREPVVAAHYAEFSLARARVIRLRHDELGYASYHLADHLLLDEKEGHLASRRSSSECRPESRADAFAETASPTWPCRRSPREPDEKLLSTPFVPTRVNIDPVFLTSGPIGPDPAAAPVHLAMNDLLPPSNPGTGPGFPPLLPILCRGHPSPPHLPRHPIRCRNLLIHLRRILQVAWPSHRSQSSAGHDFYRLRKNHNSLSSRAKRGISFAKCQGKSRFLTPQTPFGMTKREFFRSLFWSCRKR
jgi:hypothetical protein